MSVWDLYKNRLTAQGSTKRETILNRELYMLNKKLCGTLSYYTVLIDGESHDVAIVSSDSLNEKTIYSMEKDEIRGGELVYWMNNYWLVVECDANNEIYTKATLRQCNYLLRWVDPDGVIHEQWCIVEDGTKYTEGEHESGDFVVTRGDTRMVLTIAKNADTVKFVRGWRFLIDDPDSPQKLSYVLTNPLKIGVVYNGRGVYSFVLQEDASTSEDNHELSIADYYKYFLKETEPADEDTGADSETETTEDGKKVWL